MTDFKVVRMSSKIAGAENKTQIMINGTVDQ